MVLLAVGSGDPRDISSFQSGVRSAWRGRAVAIVQPSHEGAQGRVVLEASTLEGNVNQSISIQVS